MSRRYFWVAGLVGAGAIFASSCRFKDFEIVEAGSGTGATGAHSGSGEGAQSGSGSTGGSNGGSAGVDAGSGGDSGAAGSGGSTGGTAGNGGAGGLAGAGSGGEGAEAGGGAGGSTSGPCSNLKPNEHCSAVVLDTTPTGADVPTAVTDFPVLLRLNRANFDFLSADPVGEDLRFIDLEERALSFEIESFSRAEARAEIWVKVPDISGNAQQTFSMIWGPFGSTSASDPRAVFDTENAFTGTWHFALGALDATANGINGTDHNTGSILGIIGSGRSFLADADIIDFGQPETLKQAFASAFTLSFWMRSELGRGVLLANKALPAEITRGFALHLENGNVNLNFADGQSAIALQGFTRVDDDRWHHVAATFDPLDRVRLYVDGERENAAEVTHLGPTLSALNLVLGHDALASANSEYDGMIDELRVEHTPRDAAWIRLLFRSQSASQQFATIRPER